MRVSVRRLIAWAAVAAVALGMPGMAQSFAQDNGLTATPERPAALTLTRPPLAAGNFLDLWVKAYTPPRQGAVEAVVTVGPPGRGAEVGRFAVFPAEPFTATDARQQRAYRFDASAALRKIESRGPTVAVRVELVPIGDKTAAAGARLELSKAEFSARP